MLYFLDKDTSKREGLDAVEIDKIYEVTPGGETRIELKSANRVYSSAESIQDIYLRNVPQNCVLVTDPVTGRKYIYPNHRIKKISPAPAGGSIIFFNGSKTAVVETTETITQILTVSGQNPPPGNRLRAVINILDNTLAPPGSPTIGDRYILDNTGASHPGWGGAQPNDIVEWDGFNWITTTPEEGNTTYVDDLDQDAIFVDDGVAQWELRPNMSTAGGDLQGTYPNPTLSNQSILGKPVINVDYMDSFLFADQDDAGNLKRSTIQQLGNVINPDHTGEVTSVGAATTVESAAITNKPAATVAGGDLILIADIDDSNNLKQVTASAIAALSAYTHPNHTGDVTSVNDGATTAQPVMITGKPAATVAGGDLILIADIDDSNDLKQVTASAIAALSAYTHPNHTGDVTSVNDGATTAQPVMITGKSNVPCANDDKVLITDTSDSDNLKHVTAQSLVDSTKFIQGGQTTDATPTLLIGSQLIPNNSNMSFIIRIQAIQSAGAAGTPGDSWVHEIRGAVKNIGGTSTLIDVTDESLAEDAAAAAWTVSVTANDTTDALDITVTGELNKTIEWRSVNIYETLSY
jgi:hypothetical protein